MPNKLTDSEIVKALECCSNDDCYHCPMGHHATGTYNENCGDDLMKFALDLINRYEEKNSNLTSDLTSAKAEIERLKKEIELFKRIGG